MGVHGVCTFTVMIGRIRHQDWQAAADAALDSLWAKTETPARAERVTKLLLSGIA